MLTSTYSSPTNTLWLKNILLYIDVVCANNVSSAVPPDLAPNKLLNMDICSGNSTLILISPNDLMFVFSTNLLINCISTDR